MTENGEKKSPIKNLPVRLPGQSLREQWNKLIEEEALPWIIAIAGLCGFVCMEWMYYWLKTPRSPWTITIFALVLIPIGVWKIRKAALKARQLNLGIVGEEAVGQFLEEKLRPAGCQVLHDIPGEGFNVDHVVIGPTGIFSVETKTCRKPAKGESSVKYDGEHITVNGFTPDRDPVVQAKAEAHWLHELLESSTGKKFPVKPIVLYPGWYVDKMPEGAEVWVLNEKALPTFIRNHRNHLPPEDINLVTFHLKRYVIAKTKEETEK